MSADASQNHSVYQRSEVVTYYAHLRGLQESEAYLFDKYVRSGARVLDLGVGGGRTTDFLSGRASHYVGVDYAPAMVETCHALFPHLDFRHLDASQLSAFADASFDTVVFSFNGMGYMHPADVRRQCLSECARVLVDRGTLIFSVHNARNLIARPLLANVGLVKKAWRVARAAFLTARATATALPSRAFWSGDGFVTDPVHGGLRTHVSTPERVAEELAGFGFVPLETVSADYPRSGGRWTAPWFYYAFAREARA